MHELNVADYDRARPIFREMEHHLAVRGILEGSVLGRIYADHPTHPQAALTWTKQRFYLAGSPHNEEFNEAIRRFFAETVYAQALETREEMFVLYYAPEDWENQIDLILRDKFPIKTERQFYTFRELRNDWRAMLPEDFTLRFVDQALLENRRLENLDELMADMCSERQSVQEFLDKSFGVCLAHGDELVGWCLSEYNNAGRCEVGIETLEGYRQRGFATLMVSALIEHALSVGNSQLGWHCYAGNAASIATARKVGFEKVRDYPVYMVWFDEIDNLAVHGNVCFQQERYEEALAWYERAFARGEAQDWAYWGAACASSQLGQRDAAFRYLAQAIDRGFIHLHYLENSEHLKGLHGTEEWRDLIRRLEGKPGR